MKKKTERRKPGRPTTFTAVTAEEICALLIEGKTLRQIEQEKGMPSRKTMVAWLARNDGFRAQYARAREIQALEDYREVVKNGKTETVFDRQNVERSKLRVDARKWLMARRMPKRYGDKLGLDHSGELKVSIAETMKRARERLRKMSGEIAASSER